MTDEPQPLTVFPHTFETADGVAYHPGIELRDWFAAQVIGGMSARDSFDAGQATPQDRARLAYIEADAMLAERAK